MDVSNSLSTNTEAVMNKRNPLVCTKMEECWETWMSSGCHEKYGMILDSMFAREGMGMLPTHDRDVMERMVAEQLTKSYHRKTLARLPDKWHVFNLALLLSVLDKGKETYKENQQNSTVPKYTHSYNPTAFGAYPENHLNCNVHIDLSRLFLDSNQQAYQNFLSWLWYIYNELKLPQYVHALCLNERGYNAFRSMRLFLDVDRVDKTRNYLKEKEGKVFSEVLDPLIKDALNDLGVTDKRAWQYVAFKRESRGAFHVVFQKLVWCPSSCLVLEKDSMDWNHARADEEWIKLFKATLQAKINSNERAKNEFEVDNQCVTNLSMPLSLNAKMDKKPRTANWLKALIPGEPLVENADDPTDYVYKKNVANNPSWNPLLHGSILYTAFKNPYTVTQLVEDVKEEQKKKKKRQKKDSNDVGSPNKTVTEEERTEDDAGDDLATSRKKTRKQAGSRMAPDPNGREAMGEYYWPPFDLYAERPVHGRDLMLQIRREYEQSSAYGTGNEEEVYEEAVCNALNRHVAVLERGPAVILRRRYRADNDANVLEFDDNWKKQDFFSNYSNIFLSLIHI